MRAKPAIQRMRIQKRPVLLALIFLATISVATSILYYKTTHKYHHGNFFELLEFVPKTDSPHLDAGKQRNETLQNGWSRVAVLSEKTEVWKTTTEFMINAASVPKLFCENRELVRQNDIFQKEAPAGRWTSSKNKIWIVLPAGENPAAGSYRLEYKADLRATQMHQREHLQKTDSPYSLGTSSRQISLFQTRHSIHPCTAGGKVSLNDGERQIEYLSGLLSDPKISEGWTYIEPAHFNLLKTDRTSPFKMYGSAEVYTNVRYYTAGIVRWTFTAAAFLAGNELPRIVVSIDNKKVGTVKPKTREYKSYSVQTFLNEGFHSLRAQFVNDYYNKTKKLDRNILLSRVDVEYIPLVVIATPAGSSSNRSYHMEYCTSDYTKPFVEIADLSGYVRESLLFPPTVDVTFPLRLPKRPRLIFGIHPLSIESADITPIHLKVTAKPLFGSPKELFSQEITTRKKWLDQSIDLGEFSGKFLELKFETLKSKKAIGEPQPIAVSNPIVFSEEKLPEKPIQHIFIVTADALRADHLGCYGYARATSPNIDRFSKDAVRFENAVSQGAGTLPSTASLFTSVYPSTHKCDVNTSKLPAAFLTLPEIMETKGYMTAGFVQNEFLTPPHGLTNGFRWYQYDRFLIDTEKRLDLALEWIQSMRRFPSFVFFHMLHPHSPYTPPPDIAQLFNVSLSPLASSNQKLLEVDAKRILLPKEEREQLITLYDAEIRYLDTLFGTFIQRLKQLKIYDGSIIIFLSDHGEAFQEHGRLGHGGTVYQEMIRVPLLIKLPFRSNRRGIALAQNVETMDVMPTILEVLRLPVPGFFQGKSLMPLMLKGGKQNTRTVFSEVLSGKLLGAINNNHKYIYSGQTGKEELYDIRVDPGETKDLSQTSLDLLKKFRQERSSFFNRAAEWRKKHIQTEGEHIVLDEEQTEELKALGYIQE